MCLCTCMFVLAFVRVGAGKWFRMDVSFTHTSGVRVPILPACCPILQCVVVTRKVHCEYFRLVMGSWPARIFHSINLYPYRRTLVVSSAAGRSGSPPHMATICGVGVFTRIIFSRVTWLDRVVLSRFYDSTAISLKFSLLFLYIDY